MKIRSAFFLFFITFFSINFVSANVATFQNEFCENALGKGLQSGWTVSIPLETEAIKSWLPDSLEIKKDSTGEAKPKVYFFLGKQENVEFPFSYEPWNYNEFMVFVVGLVEKKSGREVIHFPKLLLDHSAAIWAGYFYGFPKKKAQFETKENFYAIYKDKQKKNLILSAEFSSDFEFKNPFAYPHIVNTLLEADRPIHQRTELGFDVWFNVKWVTSGENFYARPAKSIIKIHKNILKGLPVGTYKADGSSVNLPIAFEFQAAWCLDEPKLVSNHSN